MRVGPLRIWVCAGLWLLNGLLVACTEPDSTALKPTAASDLEVGRLLGGAVEPGFAVARAGTRLEFPRDHGAHPAYRSEWWYLTLMLQGTDGQEYGGQFTLFRQASAPGPLVASNPWRGTHLFMAHAALTDVTADAHWHAQRFTRGHPELAGVQADPFRLWIDGWSLSSQGVDFLPLSLQVRDPALALQLDLLPGKPRVLQGLAGYSAKGPGQGSYYYSYSRLKVRGTVRGPTAVGAGAVGVTGTAWLDREWSTSVLSPGQQGWDWFALQLEDGRDLMLYRLRRDDGTRDEFDRGLLVAADGQSQTLMPQEFRLTPTQYWRDSQNTCWPTQWQIVLNDESFVVQAMVDNQLMDTAIRYWEGLIRVSQAGAEVGRGYMELTGYLPQAAPCD